MRRVKVPIHQNLCMFLSLFEKKNLNLVKSFDFCKALNSLKSYILVNHVRDNEEAETS